MGVANLGRHCCSTRIMAVETGGADVTASPAPGSVMTAEEVMQLPDDGQLYELDEGRLIVLSPAAYWSGTVAAAFAVRIGSFILEHRLGIFAGPDGGMLLSRGPDTLRAPDFSFVRRERLPEGVARPGVLSRDTRLRDRSPLPDRPLCRAQPQGLPVSRCGDIARLGRRSGCPNGCDLPTGTGTADRRPGRSAGGGGGTSGFSLSLDEFWAELGADAL